MRDDYQPDCEFEALCQRLFGQQASGEFWSAFDRIRNDFVRHKAFVHELAGASNALRARDRPRLVHCRGLAVRRLCILFAETRKVDVKDMSVGSKAYLGDGAKDHARDEYVFIQASLIEFKCYRAPSMAWEDIRAALRSLQRPCIRLFNDPYAALEAM